jgi:hypothetical protein
MIDTCGKVRVSEQATEREKILHVHQQVSPVLD